MRRRIGIGAYQGQPIHCPDKLSSCGMKNIADEGRNSPQKDHCSEKKNRSAIFLQIIGKKLSLSGKETTEHFSICIFHRVGACSLRWSLRRRIRCKTDAKIYLEFLISEASPMGSKIS